MTRLGLVALIGYIATIFLANWLIQHVGIITLWPTDLQAPAGVLAVGLAFTLRDITQTTLGRPVVVAAIVIGAALSWLVAPSFAVASGVAFLASELADFTIYTPLEQRRWIGAVVASNIVGAIVDSWLFLTIAFGSTEFLAGQVVGKIAMTAFALPFLYPIRRALLARNPQTELA